MTRSFNFGDLLELIADAIPDELAVVADDVRLTYRALDARASRVAASLRRRGVERGMTVGLMMYTGLEYLESFLAACKIGALPFNVNYRYEPAELLYLLRNAEVSTLILHSRFEANIRTIKDKLPTLRHLVVAYDPGENPSSDVIPYPVLRDEPLGATDIRSGRSDDDGLLIYTGGTTGRPKGVHWTHRNLFFGALAVGTMHPDGPPKAPEEIGLRAAALPYRMTGLSLLPLMHGAGLYGFLTMLFSGHHLVLYTARSFDGPQAWDLVEREKVTSLSFVGDAMAAPLLDAYDAHPGRWNTGALQVCSWGGASLSMRLQDALAQRFPNVMRFTGLGSSESGTLGMGLPPEKGEGLLRMPPSEKIAVIVEGQRFAQPGETGILARTGFLPLGYWRDPEKTAETFPTIDGRRWVLTGDLARLDPDGLMTFFGRDSTSINTGGEKVFAEEVEAAICAHPAVRDALVVGVPDERWGQAVVAVAALRPGMSITLEELHRHCEGQLARYKFPKRLVLEADIKRSPAGKPDYQWAKSVAAAS